MTINITQCRKREYVRFGSRSTIALVLAFLLLLLPEIAEACSATGLFTLGGGNQRCDPAQTGVFAAVLCFFESALEAMLGSMYCAFQENMQRPIAAAFGIFVSLFGVCILSGYFRMQFHEAVKVVAKLALVTVFAFNSDYAIQLTGKFFMGMLQSGTQFVLNPLGGSASLTQPDSLITGMFNFMTDPNLSNLSNTNNCGGLPCMNESILKIFSNCAAFLAVLGLALVVFLPVVIAFLFMLLIQYLSLYVKSLLAYLTSIVIITFLLILSPLFVSFALFSATSELFTRWRQYLQMFSIQGIILFAFLAMLGVITQGFTGFLYGLLRLLRPYDVTMVISLWTIPIDACSICEYKIDQLATGSQTISCQPAITKVVGTTPETVTPYDFPPRSGSSGVTNGVSTTATMPNGVSPATPITYDLTMGSVLSSKANDIPGEPSQHSGYNYVIPITNLLKKADFILYVAMNIIAFGIVASLFQEFIGKSTELAKKLGGVSGAGGFGGHADFEGGSIALGGSKAVAAGIKGMEKEMLRDPFNNVDGNIFNRFKNGLLGRSTVNRKDFNTNEGYLEAKKGEVLTGGLLGALMYGTSEDGKEKEKEYDLKLAQRRVDDAALKLRETRESAETTARGLSDALDAKAVADKKGSEVEKAVAAEQVEKAAKAYNTSYDAALRLQKTLRERKQELRDTEFAMQQGLEGGLMPGRGRVMVPEVGAAALFASSNTLRRASRKLEKEDPDGAKGLFDKKFADPNAVAVASGRSAGGNTSGRNNSSDDVISAQVEANQKLDDLDEQVKKYGQFFDETKKAEYIKAIATAKTALGKAKTERDTFEAMKDVREMEGAFDRFSNKNMMEGVAVAGVAAVGAYMLKASGIVPTAYLQEAAKFLDGADKEIKKGEAGAAEIARKVGEMPKKMVQSVVNGAQEQASLAARVVPEESLQKTNAKIAQAEGALKSAKEPMDYMNILASLEGLPRDQLATVFGQLGFQKGKAEATLASVVAMPRGWESATSDSKRNYIGNIAAKTRQELDSTSGLRSDEENEARRKELDKIKEEAEKASTEEELNNILQRTTAAQKSVNDSVLPGSAFDIFALYHQKVEQAQTAAGSAKTGDDHSRVLSSLLSAPQDLNQSVISMLQQHTQRQNNLMPPHLRQKMETELAKAHIEAKRAVTGKEQDDLLSRLGKSFVGGETAEATIAMTQWDNTPEDKKREAAERLLADAKEKFEGIASKLPDKDRKAYEEELSKASVSLAAASNGEQVRGVVAQTISIGTVLKESGLKADSRQEREEARRARRQAEHAATARELSPGGVTMGEMNLGSHVMLTLRDYDITKDSHKKDYGKQMLSKIEGTYHTASAELSEGEKTKYEQELEKIKADYEVATSDEQRRSTIAKAAALEGNLLITAQHAKEEEDARRRDAEEDAEEPVFEGDIPRDQPQNITASMPALNASMLTGGNSNMGFAMYTMQSLKAFDSVDDKRKREYFGAFIEKSKRDIDAIDTLSAEQKEQHKKDVEQISAGLAAGSSNPEMRLAMEQALKAVGRVNAGGVAVAPQFITPPVIGRPDVSELTRPPVSAQTADDSRKGDSTTRASTLPPSASSSSADRPEPMSASVGRIEVAGVSYQTSKVYESLDDGDKQRVQNILARNPEMTLQQAITQMNDEQALKRSRSRREKEEGIDTSEEKSETAKTKASNMSLNAQQKARQQEQKQVQEKAKKTRDNLSMSQLQKIHEMMKKNPGMTQEKAIEKLGLKGKI